MSVFGLDSSESFVEAGKEMPEEYPAPNLLESVVAAGFSAPIAAIFAIIAASLFIRALRKNAPPANSNRTVALIALTGCIGYLVGTAYTAFFTHSLFEVIAMGVQVDPFSWQADLGLLEIQRMITAAFAAFSLALAGILLAIKHP